MWLYIIIVAGIVALLVVLVFVLNKDRSSFDNSWLSLNSDVSSDILDTAKQKLLRCVKASPNKSIEARVLYKAYPASSTILGEANWSTQEIWLNKSFQYSTVNLNDTSESLLGVVLLHELLHVMGLLCLSPNSNRYCDGNKYTGPNGLARYNEMRAKNNQAPQASFIAIEADYGSGTAGAHLDEDGGNIHTVLQEEIQSGVLNPNNYFTSLTLGLLQDAGWNVDYDCSEIMDKSPNMTWI